MSVSAIARISLQTPTILREVSTRLTTRDGKRVSIPMQDPVLQQSCVSEPLAFRQATLLWMCLYSLPKPIIALFRTVPQ